MIRFGAPVVTLEDIALIPDIVAKGELRQGRLCQEAESWLTSYTGITKAITVSSCTAGLHLLLRAIDVSGKEVIVPTYTHFATITAAINAGATVVLADVDQWGNLCIESVRSNITAMTAAVIAVHMFGRPVDLSLLKQLCDPQGVAIVEDCAYAIGAREEGMHVGSLSAGGVLSFGVLKPLTCGEGGAVLTNDLKIAHKIQLLRNYGMSGVVPSDVGLNYKFTEIAASILLGQAKRIDAILGRKKRIESQFSYLLDDILEFPKKNLVHDGNCAFTICRLRNTKDYDSLLELQARGVCEFQFITPVHMKFEHPAITIRCSLLQSEQLVTRLVCLPSHLLLSDEDIESLSNSISGAIRDSMRAEP